MSIENILKSVIIVLLMTSLGFSQSVRESFDYAPGPFEGSGEAGNGWGGPWTIFEGSTDLMEITEGSLEYSGIPTLGNALMGTMSATDNNQRAYRELATVWPDTGGSYWMSFLMEIYNTNSVDQSWQGVSLYLNDGTEPVLFGKVWGLPNFGLMAHSLGGAATTSPLTWQEGRVWILIRMDMSGDDQNERCFMWINPSPASEPDTTAADVKAAIQLNNGFERVVVHFGRNLALVTYFDELRLGTSFEDVSSSINSVSQHENQLPKQIELSNNYPNPFNPTTNIPFYLPSRSVTTLKIFDVLGKEVAVLVNKELSAGRYTYQWNAENKPSGVYFYQLQAGTFTETKKLLLLR
jgi:hypothetical protein